ncbi:hypothetical protein TraAM80_03410 [Trypanosoma rangeli]|uniref:Uncharacterized protein n=1 Tax=Trypanosoma rangeli TaxID=5698 RepID=A0A3R7KJ17_TRYRA|nr:uncharacterized protein TraAM80_03410 [Trypanosoma rangeli]RNF07435.1 hypothetical protein TraAM80_03410 [Trypanosoma rangeli]|eukprot:RNF07435.1 hypothetical protein TraAM80_03410 [Trypanosoma rangeli]
MRTKRRHGHVVGLRLCLAVTLRRHRDVSRLCRTMLWVKVHGLRWKGSNGQSGLPSSSVDALPSAECKVNMAVICRRVGLGVPVREVCAACRVCGLFSFFVVVAA